MQLVTDPQIDFPRPGGVSWPVFGASVEENNTVANIGELFEAAKRAGVTVAVSPHYFYPTDKQWRFGDPLEQFMGGVGMFARSGRLHDGWICRIRCGFSCPVSPPHS